MEWTPISLKLLQKRYLWQRKDGRETPEQMFLRVAKTVSSFEKRALFWKEQFYQLMAEKKFFPNSPALINAGKKNAQLCACYVLPVSEHLDVLFQTLKYAAKIQASGGGTGFSFSKMQPQGIGPLGAIHLFNEMTSVMKQSGIRRGANMAVLRVDHPDILAFVEAKKKEGAFENFNFSVGITDEFLRAWKNKEPFYLKSKKKKIKISARWLWRKIAKAAWSSGDPGVLFLDTIEKQNPTPHIQSIEATNPCGEQPLLAYESCHLGSLNLMAFFKKNRFDWEGFLKAIDVSVRFLDDLIDAHTHLSKKFQLMALGNRKIGLGVMGFSDLLLALRIAYDRPEGLRFGKKLMSFLKKNAQKASIALGREKGVFPNWKGSLWEKRGLRLRNAALTSIAPTGSISLLAGVSSGIEPVFDSVFVRKILEQEGFCQVHPFVLSFLKKNHFNETFKKKVSKKLKKKIDLFLKKKLGSVWKTAYEISAQAQVRMQAVFQAYCDGAVSKTVHLKQNTSAQEIEKIYLLAYQLGCKGITVYRDQSKSQQVFTCKRV